MPDIKNNEYIVPNRAKPLTIVESSPINENWEAIQSAINKNYSLASEVQNKIDRSEKGVQGGVATLDEDNKLDITQLPYQAKGHVFKVKSLAEQLSLQAFSGDICVREDIGKTYSLSVDSPGMFSNWVEIATINGGGDLIGNPTYTTEIKLNSWQYNAENNNYSLTYEDLEHGQGQNHYLLVEVKDSLGRDIDCEKIIDSKGTVTVISNVQFEGFLIISNLLGNCKNLKAVPYSILQAGTENNKPYFINYSLDTVYLLTDPPIVVIDGMDLLQTIKISEPLKITKDFKDGEYILFIDSNKIEQNKLTSITYLLKEDYLGIKEELPKITENGKRCYVAYDKSYEIIDSAWRSKAFVPVGEITVIEGLITNAISYPFHQNGVVINYKSSQLDYLFGSKTEGLEVMLNEKLLVNPGRCLVENSLVNLKAPLDKTFDTWEQGNNKGCIDPLSNYLRDYTYEVTKDEVIYYVAQKGERNSYVEIGVPIYRDKKLQDLVGDASEFEYVYNGTELVEETLATGWGNIYLISDEIDKTKIDILVAFTEDPVLPIGFNIKRQIGYLYRDINSKVREQIQLKNKIYFKEPIEFKDTVSNEIKELPVDLPLGTDIILSYSMDELHTITFLYNSYQIANIKGYGTTLQLPHNKLLEIKSDSITSINIKIQGYTDRS